MTVDELAAAIRAEVERVRQVAQAATPGPWERGPRRNSPGVLGLLPEDEQGSWIGGTVPADLDIPYAGERERVPIVQVPTWSDHRFFRKRSGRDLDHIALHDPARVLARCNDDLARVDRDLAALSTATYPDGTVETGSWLARAALNSLRSLARVHGINP